MTTTIGTFKGSGLAKSDPAVRNLASRLERARQARNAKIAQADADYVESVRRALATIEPVNANADDADAAADAAPDVAAAS